MCTSAGRPAAPRPRSESPSGAAARQSLHRSDRDARRRRVCLRSGRGSWPGSRVFSRSKGGTRPRGDARCPGRHLVRCFMGVRGSHRLRPRWRARLETVSGTGPETAGRSPTGAEDALCRRVAGPVPAVLGAMTSGWDYLADIVMAVVMSFPAVVAAMINARPIPSRRQGPAR